MVAIFVLAGFISILLLDLLVLKLQGKVHPAFEAPSPIYEAVPSLESGTALPSNLFLSKGHTWLKKNSEGLIEIGIDSFASSALGSLSITKAAEQGSKIKRGDILFVGNYGTESVEFLSPISGKIKNINRNIIGNKISSPYQTWGIQIDSNDMNKKGNHFFAGKEAIDWLKTESQKLKNILEPNFHNVELVGQTMFDGGTSSDTNSFAPSNSLDVENNFASAKKFSPTNSFAPTNNIVNEFKKEFLSLE
jgi:glycine cleavage system H protein